MNKLIDVDDQDVIISPQYMNKCYLIYKPTYREKSESESEQVISRASFWLNRISLQHKS